MPANRPEASFEIAGVNALLVRLGDELQTPMPAYFKAVCERLLCDYSSIVTQVVPAYTTLLVQYDARNCRMYDLQLLIEKILEEIPYQQPDAVTRLVEVPVCYGGEFGPDLDAVACRCELTSDEVIRIHRDTEYQVYAQGFAPGFTYLGQLDERIRVPRLETPRKKVPAGSLAIAEQQTAVYPGPSPGGWNLIGYSDFVWFDVGQDPMSPLSVGDRVQFIEVSEADMKARIKQGGSHE
ncbi:5-oxoprolinase subunit PxpB [Aliidiomarina sp. Khilg15.8]